MTCPWVVVILQSYTEVMSEGDGLCWFIPYDARRAKLRGLNYACKCH